MRKTRVMYMHTLDGKPASYFDMHGTQGLTLADNGHASRAAKLVPTLHQIRQEHGASWRSDLAYWKSMKPEHRDAPPSFKRYGYVLVKVDASSTSQQPNREAER
jgi:hypothetical protein